MKNHSLQLKFPGGKTHVAKDLLAYAPWEFTEYRDPFCGNCPWITYTDIIPTNMPRWINDLDEYLYAYIIGARDDISWIPKFAKLRADILDSAMKMRAAFFAAVGLVYRKKCPMSYLLVRRLAHRQIVRPIKRSGASMLGFHFINTGLRGVHISDLYEVHELLQGVRVTNQDGFDVITAPTDGVCWMTIDPPYRIRDHAHGFYDHEFTPQDHRRLRDTLAGLNPRTHKFMLTIDRTPLNYKLYALSRYARRGLFRVSKSDVRTGLFRVSKRDTRTGMTGNKDRKLKTELVVRNYDD